LPQAEPLVNASGVYMPFSSLARSSISGHV